MKLITGLKLTAKEVAEFLNISYGSFRNNKDTKLKDFSNFCDWHQEGRKYVIDTVKIEEFIKIGQRKAANDKEVFVETLSETGMITSLDTISKVAQGKLQTAYGEVCVKTSYNRMSIAKCALYGKEANSIMEGERGHYEMVWGKEVAEDRYEELIGEELKQLKEMITDFYKKLGNTETIATLTFDLENGEITAEYFAAAMIELNKPKESFDKILQRYENETGIKVKRLTKFIDNAFNNNGK